MIEGTVLIIEDDRETRDALQFAFIRRSWEVAVAVTEEQARLILADYEPDWVIASWEQLGGTGHGFIRELRARPERVWVSILTESQSCSAPFVALLKPDLVLAKPIQADAVYQSCHSLLRGKSTGCVTPSSKPA